MGKKKRKKSPKKTDMTRVFRYALLAITLLVAVIWIITVLGGGA